MMHYSKGENVEKEITKEDLPFQDCMPKDQRDNFLWMHVRGGTKVNNVISYAKNALEKGEYRTVVWSGAGGGLVKTVSCAEIIKRSFPLYQVTRMCYTIIEEHWKPQLEGLEEIVANRQIPCLHILMSLDPIDVDGVQKPNTVTDFWHEKGPSSTASVYRRNNFWQGQQQKRVRSGQKKRNNPQQKQQPLQQTHQQQEPPLDKSQQSPTQKAQKQQAKKQQRHQKDQHQKRSETASQNTVAD